MNDPINRATPMMTDKETRIREIVRKIAEAEQLGGGFRLYFETAVRDLLELCEPEAPNRKGQETLP